MNRTKLIVPIAVGGALALVVWISGAWDPEIRATDPTRSDDLAPRAPAGTGAGSRANRRATGTAGPADRTSLERRIGRLENLLAEERSQRLVLETRISSLLGRVERAREDSDPASGTEGGPTDAATRDPASPAPSTVAPPQPGPGVAAHGRTADSVDYTVSRVERALVDAGLDSATAEGIKLHRDELAMTEMYLRDQATREGWLDTPRFVEEMAAVAAERISIRDEIGDDAYDSYLFAMGQRNRVIVNDVMARSAAEEAGLQSGDLIISYDATRVFTREDLVDETHNGDIGDSVMLRIIRNREAIEIEVPRGPLGLRIGSTQDDPNQS